MFKISAEHIKDFMNILLRSKVFDFLEVRSIEIITFTLFSISGHVTDNYNDEKPMYHKWSRIKPYVFDIIKGSTKPRLIKIVFSLEASEARKLHDNAAVMHINMNFNGKEVYLTSATVQSVFSLDKSVDYTWEQYLRDFFKNNGIHVQPVELSI